MAQINSSINYSTVHGCMVRSGGCGVNNFGGGSYNTLSNCYIYGIYSFYNGVVDHCDGLVYTDYIYSTTLKNNIFYYYPNSACYGGSGSDNSLYNNVYINNCPNYCIGAIYIANNISASAASVYAYGGINYDDMHLAANSPALTAGENGTQAGVYGGLFPLKEGMVPSNPHIFQKTISSTTNSNEQLPVNIKVRAENY